MRGIMDTNQELWNSIKETAEYVAKMDDAADYALDFSEESIVSLEDMLEDFYGDEGPSEQNWDAMVWAFGSYLAAVINNNFNGEWVKNEETGEIIFEAETAGVGLNPFTWIAKKFDAQDSIKDKYNFITNMMKEDRKSK
jgi:hypothetical protein